VNLFVRAFENYRQTLKTTTICTKLVAVNAFLIESVLVLNTRKYLLVWFLRRSRYDKRDNSDGRTHSRADIKTAEWTDGFGLSVNYFWNGNEWNQIVWIELKWAESTNPIEWECECESIGAPNRRQIDWKITHKNKQRTRDWEGKIKFAFNFFNLAFTFLINFSLAIKIQFLLKNQVR